jgi:SMC interacting uncharacterized protein involved in chromosome segregation
MYGVGACLIAARLLPSCVLHQRSTFKKEMDKMTRTTKKLEKEKRELKSKADATDATLIELANEKLAMQESQDKMTKKCMQLESLCRALQGQLAAVRKDDNASGVAAVEGPDNTGAGKLVGSDPQE